MILRFLKSLFVYNSQRIVRHADVHRMIWYPPKKIYQGFPKCRVVVNNEDVSQICFRATEFDDGLLTAYVYVVSGGQIQIDEENNKPLTKIISGSGTIEFL